MIYSKAYSGNVNLCLPEYRSQFIDLKLKEFIKNTNIRKWPVDCVKLLKEMKDKGKYGIKAIGIAEGLSSGLDAAAHFDKKTGYYAVVINRKKFSYPFRKSSDCRLNFTIAHEIGHIVLEHVKLACHSDMDEMEADEFAARFLMPRELLLTFNYYSIYQVAAWLNVSVSALITRLVHLNRLDLLTARKVRSCINCGNIRFSEFASYCGVCGQKLSGNDRGIRRIYYPDKVKMDSFKRSLICIKCHSDIRNIPGEFCPYCHTCIFNLCSDETCSYANPPFAFRCEMCGKPTVYQDDFFYSGCDKNHGYLSWSMIQCRH